MKKILLSVSYYAPHISGLTGCVVHLAEALAHKDYQVSILTTQFDKKLARHEKRNNVSICRIPYLSQISKGFFMPSFLLEAYFAIRKCDEVIVVLPQLEGFLIALLAKIMSKKVMSYYICDVTLTGGYFSKIIEMILRRMNTLCLSLSQEIFTLTDDFARNTPILVNRNNVHELLPIIPTQVVDIHAKKALQSKISVQKKYIIGFLGRISSEKGIENLLGAIAFLQKTLQEDFIILLAGPRQAVGEQVYQEKIAKQLEAQKRYIIQLGEIPDESLAAFYSLLDVFVLPSINQTEAFGMVQVEAMRQGVPVVATNLPGVRVPVHVTGMGIIVPIKNSEAIGKAVSEIVLHKKQFQNGIAKAEMLCSEKEVMTELRNAIAV